jgi:hypothetical protein
MKLYAKVYSGFIPDHRAKGKGDNQQLTIDLQFGNKVFGRVVLRSDNGESAYYYPITEITGKSGHILLHEDAGDKHAGEHAQA